MTPHNNAYNAVFQILKLRRKVVLRLRTTTGDSCRTPNPQVLLAQPQLLRGIAFSSSSVWAKPGHVPQL